MKLQTGNRGYYFYFYGGLSTEPAEKRIQETGRGQVDENISLLKRGAMNYFVLTPLTCLLQTDASRQQ